MFARVFVHFTFLFYSSNIRAYPRCLVSILVSIQPECRLGELIIKQKETIGMNPGTRTKGGGGFSGGSVIVPPDIPTLAEAGIDKKLSSRAQQKAAIPESKFEALLQEHRESQDPISMVDCIRETKRDEVIANLESIVANLAAIVADLAMRARG